MAPSRPSVITAITALGDGALLVDVVDLSSAHRLAAAVDAHCRDGRTPAGIDEAVVGLASVVVHLQPGVEMDAVEEWLSHLSPDDLPERSTGRDGGWPGSHGQRHLEIPVVFDGPDLDEVAQRTGVTADTVVAWMTTAELGVAFVGFSPGFPYLVGLPPPLASVPRRPSPRAAVPAGSVAVGGGFASVYPQSTPGGWMLLGRTSIALFDPDRPPYATLAPGDTVRFTAHSNPGPGPAAGPGPGRRRTPPGAGSSRSGNRACSASSRTAADGARPASACHRPAPLTPRPCAWPIGWSATRTEPPPSR